MSHLPETHGDQNESLSQGPPKHSSVGAVTDATKSLLPHLEKNEVFKINKRILLGHAK